MLFQSLKQWESIAVLKFMFPVNSKITSGELFTSVASTFNN